MSKKNPTQVANDVVVSLEYKLAIDGEVVDVAEKDDPLVYLHGHENIIPGLEAELEGLKIGDAKKVVVEPEDGYGEYDDEAVQHVPKLEIPAGIPLEEGVQIEVRDEDDELTSAWISEILADEIVLDFNHPLAGDTLNFEVKVVGLRTATAEEIEHSHVHEEGHEH